MVQLRIWLPRHWYTNCWCRPHTQMGEIGDVIIHRQVILRPDRCERAFARMGDGIPV